MKKTGMCAVVFAALLLCVACAVYVHDVRKHSSLFLAALRNNVVEAWLLIQSGADVNATFGHGDTTALIWAARNNAVAVARLLITSGADVNEKDFLRETALMFAVEEAPDVAKLLIEAGADVNATDNGGVSLLMFAVERAAVLVGLLITSDADVRVSAAYDTALALVRLLIEAGADINAKNNWGKTALMYAAEEDAADMIELLKTAGAT